MKLGFTTIQSLKIAVSSILIFCSFACGPAILSKNARYVSEADDNSVKDCKFLGTITARGGSPIMGWESAAEDIQNNLRNKVSEKGGNKYVRKSERNFMSPNDCLSCLEVNAAAYQCKTK